MKPRASSQKPTAKRRRTLTYKSVAQLTAFRGLNEPALPRLRDSFEISSSGGACVMIFVNSVDFLSMLSHRIA